MIEHLWLVPLGLAAGVLGSMIGLGGGLVMVPAMSLAGFPPQLAVGNSLFAVLANAAGSTLYYSRRGLVRYRAGAALALASVPGTAAGAYASSGVPPGEFMALFGALLAASAAYMALRRGASPGPARSGAAVAVLCAGASFAAGALSGFFGVGGGVVFVQLMVLAMGMGMRAAAPTSQFVLIFASLAGAAAHASLGHPDAAQAALLAAGAFVGGLAGARASRRVLPRNLQLLAAAAVAAVAARLLAGGLL